MDPWVEHGPTEITELKNEFNEKLEGIRCNANEREKQWREKEEQLVSEKEELQRQVQAMQAEMAALRQTLSSGSRAPVSAEQVPPQPTSLSRNGTSSFSE